MKHFKAAITVSLRKSILDVQGKTVEHALHSTNFTMIKNTRIGKHIELELDAENADQAHEILSEACKTIIANPIMEDYHIEFHEIEAYS